ncbi:hypothetical protein AUJ14_05365 [Candidatus Micrarchaeota archaeon CG1_02_55_22]|nr:MAG: hypothetical protein AUJ14_05365 [Candidatus Micrarchaeota archaeon CG1_02_55_22]
MELVVDSNVAAAAVIRSGVTRNLVFNSRLTLFAPGLIEPEMLEHRAEFVQKSGLSDDAFDAAVRQVFSRITLLRLEEFMEFEATARKISPDSDDWPFIAAAMSEGCALWSNDRQLKQQAAVPVFSTEELLVKLRAAEDLE